MDDSQAGCATVGVCGGVLSLLAVLPWRLKPDVFVLHYLLRSSPLPSFLPAVLLYPLRLSNRSPSVVCCFIGIRVPGIMQADTDTLGPRTLNVDYVKKYQTLVS